MYSLNAWVYGNKHLFNIIMPMQTKQYKLLGLITAIVVNKVKKIEGVDHYDHNVDYNPFLVK